MRSHGRWRRLQLARGDRLVGANLAASAVIQALGVVTGILLARELGPEGRGELAAVLLWPAMLMRIGSLGVSESLTFYSARPRSQAGTLASTGLGLAVGQGTVLIVIGLLVVPLALSRQSGAVEASALIYLAAVPLGLVNLYAASLLNGLRHYGLFNLIRVMVIASSSVGLVVLALADELTVRHAVYAYIGGESITAVAGVALLLRAAGGPGRFAPRRARELLAYGWRAQLSTVSSMLNERLDQLVISVFLVAQDLGLYVIAWTMTTFSYLIGWSVSLAALPEVARRAGAAERRGAARRHLRLALFSAVLTAVPVFLLMPQLIDLAFGEAYGDSLDLARILLAASVVLAAARVLEAVLKGTGHPLDASLAEAAGLAVTVLGLAALLPLLGVLGAAITSAAAYCVIAAVALHRANRTLGSSGLGLIGADRGEGGSGPDGR